MKLYTIQISDAAGRQLAKLPQKDQQRINAKIVALAKNPRPPGSVRLAQSGALEQYRIRSGDYRIIYEIHENILLVLVVRIAHRSKVYRQLERLKT